MLNDDTAQGNRLMGQAASQQGIGVLGSARGKGWYSILCNSRWNWGKFFRCRERQQMPLKSSIRAATESISVKWYDDTIVYFGSVIATWLLYFSSMLKIETFSPIFPLTDFMTGAFYWLFLWNFKKESINRFLRHNHYQIAVLFCT